MDEATPDPLDETRAAMQAAVGLSPACLETYVRLFQLETWLRRMVYLELRAEASDDWEDLVERAKVADRSRQKDKRLTHMPIREAGILSYAQLTDLKQTIDKSWALFEPYLPPLDIWTARVEEVLQVRHRIAHFRSVHPDDLLRVKQLLRDLDKGVWNFCTSYNDSQPILPPPGDPVIEAFLEHDPFPWSDLGENRYARVGIRDPEALFGMRIEILRRPWVVGDWPDIVAGAKGYLYDVDIHAQPRRQLACDNFLRDTRDVHDRFAYVHPDGPRHFRVTIPAVLGKDAVIELVETLIRWIPNALNPSGRYHGDEAFPDDQLAAESPENVLGPTDPLSMLCPDMDCSMFGA